MEICEDLVLYSEVYFLQTVIFEHFNRHSVFLVMLEGLLFDWRNTEFYNQNTREIQKNIFK